MKILRNRLSSALLVLFGASFITFTLARVIPSDPALAYIGPKATAEDAERLRITLGLDQPIPVQYVKYLIETLQGNWGYSLSTKQPILQEIADRLPATLELIFFAMSFAVIFGVALGVYAAKYRGKFQDSLIRILAIIGVSMPAFWLGLILLLIFGMQLAWLPVVGYVAFSDDFYQGLRYVLLPIITLAMVETGVLIRMVRSSSIEVLRLEYVAHARAKGAGELRVLLLHVLPNSFAPVLTMIGLILGHLLGGAAVLETVFTLPGLGRLLVDAIFSRDYPVIQGVLIFTASIYVCINLVVDFCYPIFDPKVRLE